MPVILGWVRVILKLKGESEFVVQQALPSGRLMDGNDTEEGCYAHYVRALHYVRRALRGRYDGCTTCGGR